MSTSYCVTGLMSGSSLDGVDLACCQFRLISGIWDFNIVAAETAPYSRTLLDQLNQASTWGLDRIMELDKELGIFYAGLLTEFHRRHSLSPDLISSHGHTILHEPGKGITFQAGNGRIMAERTGIRVVNDFRSKDVAQGGQGAPLVPVGDRMLFSRFDACLNLGGFANISYENEKMERLAYDTGPANIALNWIAGQQGLNFDRNGQIAGRGKVIDPLLRKMNDLDYYTLPPPKSLGKEWFDRDFLPLLYSGRERLPDLMATTVEHIVFHLVASIKRSRANTILLTGGGALNRHLLERIRACSAASINLPDRQIIEFKEALVFALLGLLRIRGEINCLASVTGGRENLSTGTIHNI